MAEIGVDPTDCPGGCANGDGGMTGLEAGAMAAAAGVALPVSILATGGTSVGREGGGPAVGPSTRSVSKRTSSLAAA